MLTSGPVLLCFLTVPPWPTALPASYGTALLLPQTGDKIGPLEVVGTPDVPASMGRD